MAEPESASSLVAKQKHNACHEIMEGEEFLLISSSEGEFGVSQHVNPKNYLKYIAYLEVAKSELVDAVKDAARDDG